MTTYTEGTTDQRKRRLRMVGSGLLIVLLALIPLFNSLDNPRVATLRGGDIVRLIAVGWGFGIGATLMAIGLRLRRE